jgi:hypothetical protein
MKQLALVCSLFFFLSCGNDALGKFVKAEGVGLPKKIDTYLSLTSVQLADKRVVYTFELSGMTKGQQGIMINATRDQAVKMLKPRKEDLKVIWAANYKIRAVYMQKGKELKSLTITERELE